MDNLTGNLFKIMFGDSESINWGDLRIDPPEDLPPALGSHLASYNEAIWDLDIEKAEELADKMLQWLMDPK
jgi:hypothetical protein